MRRIAPTAIVLALGLCTGGAATGQPVVDQMTLAELRVCGDLAVQRQALEGRSDPVDAQLAAEGRAIHAESAAINAARSAVNVHDRAAVARFETRVATLNARVAAYNQRVRAQEERENAVVAEFNVKCAERPYDPALLKSLTTGQAAALRVGASEMADPAVVRSQPSIGSGPAAVADPSAAAAGVDSTKARPNPGVGADSAPAPSPAPATAPPR